MDLIENQKITSINEINSKNIPLLEKLELASVLKRIPKVWKENTYTQHDIDFISFYVQKIGYIEIKMKSRDEYKSLILKK